MHNVHLRWLVVTLALALAFLVPSIPASARPHPRPTPSATPIPAEIPLVHKEAIQQLVRWQAGVLDRSDYDAAFNAGIPDATVKRISLELGQKGALESAVYLGPVVVDGAPAGVVSYLYKMLCANGVLYERLSIEADGKIAGVLFRDTLNEDSAQQ